MTPLSYWTDRASLLGKLRWAGVGMATVEMIYLVGWMTVDLGLLETPSFGHTFDGSTGSLRTLVDGMLWAAAFGIAGGLVTAFGAAVVDVLAGQRVCRQSGQAFARSLVVRNQIR
ncbi:MAG: hypothetical protein ACOYM5_12400 [Caulobacter sp.]